MIITIYFYYPILLNTFELTICFQPLTIYLQLCFDESYINFLVFLYS